MRPGTDEPDYRPLPKPNAAETAIRQISDGVVDLVSGSRLEDDAEDLLWSLVNVFHRKVARVERDLAWRRGLFARSSFLSGPERAQ
ncbi:MAG: hypothetical protein ACLFWF_13980 [Alphaproteobacteria bacterium]